MSSVKSSGKPYVSNKRNAETPSSTVSFLAFNSSIAPFRRLIPRSSVRRKESSSSFMTRPINSCCAFNSGKASPISLTSTGSNLNMNASFWSRKVYAYLTARRKIRRITYPALALEGNWPSAIENATARRWSAHTRIATSMSSFSPYFNPVMLSSCLIMGWKISVS